ncbi:MAG TPA: cytochrome c oxidase subunit II [Stellaceae bacterium]|nr:cytochrome c oxidase subunit II [Stellaceae bacterium]
MLRLIRGLAWPAARKAAALFGLAAIGMVALAGAARAASGYVIGPEPWELAMQGAATPVKARVIEFHHELLAIIFLITILVLGLLVYVMVRFNSRRHPVPSHTTHNTPVEVLWTVIPVLILVIIAVPSFKLMYYMDRVPNADMTIKVTGHQWYWSYAYPDQGGLSFDSNIVPEANLKPGQPRLLTVNNPLVVPVGAKVRVLIGSTDVIHSWFVPSFGVQEYAMPGQVNESWFQVERAGTYYGECNQICGVNHAFMPIVIEAVPKDQFRTWLAAAKKKFASNDEGGAALRVAALSGTAGAAAPASAEIAQRGQQ